MYNSHHFDYHFNYQGTHRNLVHSIFLLYCVLVHLLPFRLDQLAMCVISILPLHPLKLCLIFHMYRIYPENPIVNSPNSCFNRHLFPLAIHCTSHAKIIYSSLLLYFVCIHFPSLDDDV